MSIVQRQKRSVNGSKMIIDIFYLAGKLRLPLINEKLQKHYVINCFIDNFYLLMKINKWSTFDAQSHHFYS